MEKEEKWDWGRRNEGIMRERRPRKKTKKRGINMGIEKRNGRSEWRF